jgi:hypothetical protein
MGRERSAYTYSDGKVSGWLDGSWGESDCLGKAY